MPDKPFPPMHVRLKAVIRSLNNKICSVLVCLTILVLLPLIPTFSLQAQMIDSLDRATIDSALGMLKLSPAELGFDKLWAQDDTFRLAVVEEYLSDPLKFPSYLDETQAAVDSFSRRPREMLEFIARQLRVDPDAADVTTDDMPVTAYSAADPFRLWLDALAAAEPHRRAFYGDLDSLDLLDLIMAAPGLWSEAEDSVKNLSAGAWHREFGVPCDTSREVDSDRILDIIKKLDMPELLRAGMIVLPAAQATARGAASEGVDSGGGSWDVTGVTGDVLGYAETDWGRFVVGGAGDNVYSGDFAFILDLGGDDVYRGRCGGAVGELGAPYALVIDLEGDDFYDSGGLDVAQGAGFLGIGVLIDRGGNDSYRSGAYSQGAGYFGIGVLADHGGADDRRGTFFLQGAGHCGVGMAIDDGDSTSDDRYLAACWAQGFASTFGYGLLFDSGGDDNYRAGGVYHHAPLLPDDYRSFSGGFGMGWRPRAGGGIGVLYDKGDGVDFYDAEVMSFGSSYWYSIGLLIDGGGNDYYSLAHYGLGSGIHLSLGALYDMGGDDQYRSRHGVVGATPHDLSVGIMVDGSGDDYYLVSDGWGGSLTNSFGLFIDRIGNDTYATRGGGYSFGKARWARGFAGAAIFLDLEGDDVYPAGEVAADSTTWIRSGWGIGMDLPRDLPTEKEEEVGEITLTAEDSAKTVEKLFEEASQWEVGSAKESVARARKALFTKIGEAVHYMVDNKLDSRSSLEGRLLNRIVKELPDTAGSLLLANLPDAAAAEDPIILINTVRLLGTIKWEPAVDPLLKLLRKKKNSKAWNSIISALGSIGDKRAAEAVGGFVSDEPEKRRITALNALRSLKEPATIHVCAGGLGDPMFTVRSAAILAVSAFGVDAVPELRRRLDDEEALYPESALYALGQIARNLKDSTGVEYGRVRFEVRNLLQRHLDSASEFMRAEAVVGLYRIGGDETRRMVDQHVEAEYSPVVIAAWNRARREANHNIQ